MADSATSKPMPRPFGSGSAATVKGTPLDQRAAIETAGSQFGPGFLSPAARRFYEARLIARLRPASEMSHSDG